MSNPLAQGGLVNNVGGGAVSRCEVRGVNPADSNFPVDKGGALGEQAQNRWLIFGLHGFSCLYGGKK
jgi:hypothetical protein